MNLKRLINAIDDGMNPRFVLHMRATLGKRMVATLVYLALLSVYAWFATFRSETLPGSPFELILGVLVSYMLLFFLTMVAYTRIAHDEMLMLALNDMPPLQRIHGIWSSLLFDSFYTGMTALPFILLASYSVSSFGRLLLVVAAACVSCNVFVLQILLPMLTLDKKNNPWPARLMTIFCFCAVPIGLILHMRWMFFPPFTPAVPGDAGFHSGGFLFFLIALSLYCVLGYVLCRVHLRWNLKHPYREAIVDASVFGPFGLIVFGIGYSLFG